MIPWILLWAWDYESTSETPEEKRINELVKQWVDPKKAQMQAAKEIDDQIKKEKMTFKQLTWKELSEADNLNKKKEKLSEKIINKYKQLKSKSWMSADKFMDLLKKNPKTSAIVTLIWGSTLYASMSEDESDKKDDKNKDTSINIEKEQTNKPNLPSGHKWRNINFDQKTGEYSFQSKDPTLGVRKFKSEQEAKQAIDSWVKGYHLNELKKWLQSSKTSDDAKNFVNKYNETVDLKSKWIEEKDLSTLYF